MNNEAIDNAQQSLNAEEAGRKVQLFRARALQFGVFETEIATLLAKIEKDDILPPLLVIQILSKPKTTLGALKDYLTKKKHWSLRQPDC